MSVNLVWSVYLKYNGLRRAKPQQHPGFILFFSREENYWLVFLFSFPTVDDHRENGLIDPLGL